ncbi:haloacid dehalogenase [Marinomonas piezotolerans]|uniref:Haloacid dehalogenase n=1 Tax=Marinomonas piezotolerans TaxID=2213058 RepID=A0A370U4K7_9GAMM|nr:HAD-IA family hydrolase [Marinomonas piezotolerans]RDL42687.1 haloacid dehalogenase [Marinomonas piezotolerans]
MKTLISFDLDNTLWDVDPTLVRAEHAMEKWFDERYPGFAEQFYVPTMAPLKQDVLQADPSLSSDVTKVRLAMYRLALRRYGLPSEEADDIAEQAFSVFYDWRQRIDLYPDVHITLDKLAERYELAALTNGNADVFHPSIALSRYFGTVIRADLEGIAKPDPEIFQRLAQKTGIPLDRIIHIGDHPIDDVEGAVAAGARAIWFNRHGARRWRSEWSTTPDAEVHSLRELVTVIKNMGL